MINFIPVKCPQCKADLTIEEGREYALCTYCGTKFLINDDSKKEITYRHVNEAEIQKAENERIMIMRQMDLAEQLHADRVKKNSIKRTYTVVLVAAALFLFLIGGATGELFAIALGMISLVAIMFIWESKDKKQDETSQEEKIRVPSSVFSDTKKNYASVEAILSGAGFTNVKCVPMKNLQLGILKQPGTVSSISINGREVTSSWKKYPKDVPIVISYHSMSR